MADRTLLWENHYLSLWSDGEIGVSDGVGYSGMIDADETRQLYEALRKHYGEIKTLKGIIIDGGKAVPPKYEDLGED